MKLHLFFDMIAVKERCFIMQISSRFTMAIHMFCLLADTFSDQKMTRWFYGSKHWKPIRWLSVNINTKGRVLLKLKVVWHYCIHWADYIPDVAKAVECSMMKNYFISWESQSEMSGGGKNIHHVFDVMLEQGEAMEKKFGKWYTCWCGKRYCSKSDVTIDITTKSKKCYTLHKHKM